MSTEIYYFSGTGNSLAVARDLAEKLNARLTPVARIINQEQIKVDADVFGFVFPIYDFKAPRIFNDLIPKIEGLDSKYLFAVCTYGIAPNKSLICFNKDIKLYGGFLAGGFAVRMPHNAIGSGEISNEECERDFRDWKNRIEEVSEYVKNRRRGKIDSTSLLYTILTARFRRGLPELLVFLKHLLLKGSKSLAFKASESCNGCGTCRRICPVGNIELIDNKPSWSDYCTSCFACLHWCPRKAVRIGDLKLNIRTYHHPDVKVTDMIRMLETEKRGTDHRLG